jgi:solute carrier family 35 protein E1
MDSAPNSAGPNSTTKFPAFSPDYDPRYSGEDAFRRDDLSLSNDGSPVVGPARDVNGRWAARRPSGRVGWSDASNGLPSYGARHARQKSLSEAIRNIRARRASIGQNALEIADALKVPVSPKLVVSAYGGGSEKR